jgi:hypothetical protein
MYEQVTLGFGKKSEGLNQWIHFTLSVQVVRLNVPKSAEILIVQENN